MIPASLTFPADMRPLLPLALAVLATLPLTAATISVQVAKADGSTVPDAVVYAIPAKPIPVGHKVATMDQKDRAFVPHVLPVQTGTWVQFPNSDNIRHQVYSVSPAKRFQLPLYIGKPAYPVQFAQTGVVTLGCNIHEQMSAYVVVVDTPYFATTGKGPVTLENVGAGQYTVRVWYPGMRSEPKAQSVTVGADERLSLSFVAN